VRGPFSSSKLTHRCSHKKAVVMGGRGIVQGGGNKHKKWQGRGETNTHIFFAGLQSKPAIGRRMKGAGARCGGQCFNSGLQGGGPAVP
jgi:hypothetical protein